MGSDRQITCDELMRKLITLPRTTKLVTDGQDIERYDVVTGLTQFKTSSGEVVIVIQHRAE